MSVCKFTTFSVPQGPEEEYALSYLGMLGKKRNSRSLDYLLRYVTMVTDDVATKQTSEMNKDR